MSLFTSWPPKPNSHLPKTFNEAKVESYLHISSSKVNIFQVSGNRSGVSSFFWINRMWVFHLRICLAVEKIFGLKVVLHCSRPRDLEYLGIFFCYILNIYVYKTVVCGESLRKKNLRTTSVWNIEKYFGIYRYFLSYFREISRYFLPA